MRLVCAPPPPAALGEGQLPPRSAPPPVNYATAYMNIRLSRGAEDVCGVGGGKRGRLIRLSLARDVVYTPRTAGAHSQSVSLKAGRRPT